MVPSELSAFQEDVDGCGAQEIFVDQLLGCEPHADVAQLVEHHLAKVRVAGSNPVVRSMEGPVPRGRSSPDGQGPTGQLSLPSRSRPASRSGSPRQWSQARGTLLRGKQPPRSGARVVGSTPALPVPNRPLSFGPHCTIGGRGASQICPDSPRLRSPTGSSHWLRDQIAQQVGIHRTAEIEPLAEVGVEPDEGLVLLLCLNAFAHHG